MLLTANVEIIQNLVLSSGHGGPHAKCREDALFLSHLPHAGFLMTWEIEENGDLKLAFLT